MYGQKLVEPTSAALIMSSEAIFAAFFGWMILSEILSFYGLIGASLIFLGMVTHPFAFLSKTAGRSSSYPI